MLKQLLAKMAALKQVALQMWLRQVSVSGSSTVTALRLQAA